MQTVTLKGRNFQIEQKTANILSLISGDKKLTGVRNQKNNDLVICMDAQGRNFSSFLESTKQEVVLI